VHHQGRPSVDDDPAFEDDAAAAMRGENDRLLTEEQPRQNGPPARRQGARQIGRHHGQRASQNIRQHQVVSGFFEFPIAVSRRPAGPHEACNTVAASVLACNIDGPLIDVAGQHPAAEQLCRSNR